MRAALAPCGSRGYHSLLPKGPRGCTGGAGRSEARSHARTPSPRLPLSSLPPLSTPRLRLPPPPEGTGLRSPPRRRKFGLVPSGALELSGRLSLPRAQRRNCRCRSLLSPGATLLRQVLPSFGKGCASGTGPARPCPSGTNRSRAGAPGYAPGSGCRVPHGSPALGRSVRNPAGHYCPEGEAGTGHLPAAQSIPGSDGQLASKTLHPSQPWGAVWGGGKNSNVAPPRVNNSPGGSA